MVYALLLASVLAPFFGLCLGLVMVEILINLVIYKGIDTSAADVMFLLLGFAAALYLLAGGFLRGKIAWRSPDRLKWRAVLIFCATY